jgi:DNA modification methylase
MGAHRVVCGDALDPQSYRQVMDGGLADVVFTDPPYNVAYSGSVTDRREGRTRRILNDDLGADFAKFLETACRRMMEVTKGALYICMGSGELDTLQRSFRAAGGHWSSFIIWAKNNHTLGAVRFGPLQSGQGDYRQAQVSLTQRYEGRR